MDKTSSLIKTNEQIKGSVCQYNVPTHCIFIILVYIILLIITVT